jgi:hypothetical protein
LAQVAQQLALAELVMTAAHHLLLEQVLKQVLAELEKLITI